MTQFSLMFVHEDCMTTVGDRHYAPVAMGLKKTGGFLVVKFQNFCPDNVLQISTPLWFNHVLGIL